MGGSCLNRSELLFDRPTELFASAPPERRGMNRDDVRLMVSTVDEDTHHRFSDLPWLLRPGDLLVVNESATLPASLPARSPLGDILLNLSTRFSDDLWLTEPRWSPSRPGPLPVNRNERLQIGDSTAILLQQFPGIPRLWFTRFDTPAPILMERFGGAIHYGYAPAYPMPTYQTIFSQFPGSVEMPSAARPFTKQVREMLNAKGIGVAGIILHTGVSSLEIEEDKVEHQMLYPEFFRVPEATAQAVNATHKRGDRVIAVGTTVVRALETAWTANGVRPCLGATSLFIHSENGVHAIEGLITGLHDPLTSHLAMISSIAGLDRVRKAYVEAVRNKYLWHEFGDSHLLWRQPPN